MFIKKYQIDNINPNSKDFIVFEDRLYHKKDNYSIFCLELKSKSCYEIIRLNEKINDVFLIKNKIGVTDENYKTNIFSKEKDDFILISELEFIHFKFQVNLEKYTIISKSNPNNYLDNSMGIYDADKNEILFLVTFFFPKSIFNNLLFGYSPNNELLKYETDTGEQKWSISLSSCPTYQDYPIIKKFIGVYENTLWLILSSGYLLALDVDTGEQKALIEGFPQIQNAFLDENKGVIFHFFWGYYYQIDLKDLSFTNTDLRSQMQNERYNSTLITFDDNFLYYTDGIKGWVGVIERETLRIVWQYNFKEIHKARPIELKVSESNLFIADSNNTLHIFEKEETA